MWGRRAAAVIAGTLLLAGCSDGTGDEDAAVPSTTQADADGDTTGDATPSVDTQEPAGDVPADDEPTGGPDAPSGDDVSAEEPADEATGASTGADGEGLLVAAIESASELTTARTRIESVTQTPDGELRVVGEGVQSGIDSQVTMTFSGNAAAAAELAGGEIEVILLDGVVYQRFPGLTEALGVEATWLSLDVDTLGPQFAEIIDSAEAADPADALEALRGAGKVVVVGTEEVNGVTTTHLRAEVTMRAALEAQGFDDSMIAGTGIDADEPVQYDLWVDDQSRLRRQSTELVVEGMRTATTIDVLAYDIDVTITAPPADETVDFSELFGGVTSG